MPSTVNTSAPLLDASEDHRPGEADNFAAVSPCCAAVGAAAEALMHRLRHPKGDVIGIPELGTGFHPELTGRENIFLNEAILGMTRREIRRQFDAIVDFAGTERFLDMPVKRSWSGMPIRLAF